MSDQNKAIVRMLHEEAISKANLALLDDILAPGLSYNGPVFCGEVGGADGYKRLITSFLKAFPDLKETVEHQIAEGDWVATRYRISGTHMGKLVGSEPSGTRMSVSGTEMCRLANGKIDELWTSFDALAMLQQIGEIATIELPRPRITQPSQGDFVDLSLERFKQQEAKDKIGRRVRVIITFAGLAKGTEGRVTGVALDPSGYTVEIGWRVPGKAEPVLKRASKAEYESYLIEI